MINNKKRKCLIPSFREAWSLVHEKVAKKVGNCSIADFFAGILLIYMSFFQ